MVGVVFAKDLFMVQNCPLMKDEFGKMTVPQHVAQRIQKKIEWTGELIPIEIYPFSRYIRINIVGHIGVSVYLRQAEMRKEHWAETICRVLGL